MATCGLSLALKTQQKIENPLAQKILAGDFSSSEVVNIDVEDGEFRFS
jgi:ATP-dependent Clp protease ATP-binding subunit ClpA